MTPAAFRKIVYDHFRRSGRDLPWRYTTNPYHIMVSEIMLQQTQVDRVAEKYQSFIKRFPSITSLARARLSSVLKAWQGLGYNRRAKFLHQAAQQIVRQHGGRFPQTQDALVELPGIGEHTAAAIMAYAYDAPVVYIETNIRSVFIHHFFPTRKKVSDAALLPYVEKMLDRKHPRRWYSALMDYGTWLKREHGNASRRSRHYTRQLPFAGSVRQVRGAIIRELTQHRHLSTRSLPTRLGFPAGRVRPAVRQLVDEGMVRQQGQYISLV